MSQPLEQIKEIRMMMERSSKFLSLSGLSGVSAGICALIGAWFAYNKLAGLSAANQPFDAGDELLPYMLQLGLAVLLAALILGIFFTVRKARSQGLSSWNTVSQRLLISLSIPLLAGGAFCLGLLYHGYFWFCFPATLVFYGLALVQASQYTVRDIYYLGIAEIVLGIIALFLAKYNLLLWTIGFGVLHILYGISMYLRYDKPQRSK